MMPLIFVARGYCLKIFYVSPYILSFKIFPLLHLSGICLERIIAMIFPLQCSSLISLINLLRILLCILLVLTRLFGQGRRENHFSESCFFFQSLIGPRLVNWVLMSLHFLNAFLVSSSREIHLSKVKMAATCWISVLHWLKNDLNSLRGLVSMQVAM